jgi:phytoene dehydrogenase-like protein
VYSGYDLESEYTTTREGRFSDAPFAFISLASLKDPENRRIAPPGIVNLQVMGLAPSEPEAWGVGASELESGEYRESARYQDVKAGYEARLLRSAERVFPDLSRHIVFRELATPLTHSRYTLSTGGTSYGLAATPDQVLWRRPGPKSEIPGLYLCGANTMAGHGIMGAMTGGVLAAAAIAGFSLMAEALGGAGTKALPAPVRALQAQLGETA